MPASPNAVFTEIVTTTFRNHKGDITDNVSKHNALYRAMKKGGRTRTESGGYSIVAPLEYAQNGTYQRYSGFDLLNVSQSDVFTAAEYNWRQIAINVVTSGYELRVNAGPQRIANLAKARIQNAIHTYANNFSSDMYADGSLPNQIDGLQKLVADNGQGTVGGIDSATYPFWQNVVQSAGAPLQGGSAIVPSGTAGIMQSLMLPLYIALTRGADKPNLIVSSDDWFTFYEAGLTTNQRYVDSNSAEAGFMELSYKGIPVFFDGSSGMAASRMYFLNTNYIELVVHSDANMTIMDEAKPYNQDAVVIPIISMCNMTVSNRSLQGIAKL
jgi:hypothetical protein